MRLRTDDRRKLEEKRETGRGFYTCMGERFTAPNLNGLMVMTGDMKDDSGGHDENERLGESSV